MQVKKQKDQIENYLVDASNMKGGQAERVFIPEIKEELTIILSEANELGTPITISGGRTGTVGGAVPFGGIVVSLEKFCGIEIDRDKKTATVGAGVILRDLQKAADAAGLFYPPDPTEWSAQMGGTVATNASGARSFRYGDTRQYVKQIEVFFADGDSAKIRRGENISQGKFIELETERGNLIKAKLPTYPSPNVRKNASGFYSAETVDAIDIFIGSEGVLGVITEIEFELLDKPAGSFSGIVFFPTQEDLLSFVEEARNLSFATRMDLSQTEVENDSINATTLEYFDSNSLDLIRNNFDETPIGMSGAVFFEQETDPESEDALFETWNELLEKNNAAIDESWFAINESDLEKMREFRHALPVAVNERIVKSGVRKIGTDMAVPDENFESFLNFYQAKLNESGIDFVIFGHIGDCHLHTNMLPTNEQELTKAIHLYGRFIAQAIMLGGTISAEHGIGKIKSKYLYVMYGERYINEMIELKKAFDPKRILGRDNVFSQANY